MIQYAQVLFMSAMVSVALFLLLISLVTLAFALVYAVKRGAEPVPLRRIARHELPRVTVQLPICNEGALAERIIQSAAALDYPADRLQIQVLDDSNDATSALIEHAVAAVRRERPAIDVSIIRRHTRTRFKAGALQQGVAIATGEFFAVFDADFIIPPDFLDRTIHFFTDPTVGMVQGRWAYMNRDRSTFTRFQATKLDAHQMFEQTARARVGLWVHFHGTAGVLRRSALEEVGGWNGISEVEDVELSIQTYLKGWTTIYLDRLRVPSELPETVAGFLVQQLRWKRGWIRVLKHYGGAIWRSPAPFIQRLDILVRLANAFVPLASLALTIGALPTALLAERFGFWWPVSFVYASLLVVALLQRVAEARFIDIGGGASSTTLLDWAGACLPVGFVLNMGMTPALTQGTLEGFGRSQRWDVTPKSGASAVRSRNQSRRVPASIWITIASASVAAGCLAACLWTRHFMAGVFYLLMLMGCSWIAGAFLYELLGSREASKNAPTHSSTRSTRGLRGAPGHESKRAGPDDPQSTESATVVAASVTARRIKTLS